MLKRAIIKHRTIDERTFIIDLHLAGIIDRLRALALFQYLIQDIAGFALRFELLELRILRLGRECLIVQLTPFLIRLLLCVVIIVRTSRIDA